MAAASLAQVGVAAVESRQLHVARHLDAVPTGAAAAPDERWVEVGEAPTDFAVRLGWSESTLEIGLRVRAGAPAANEHFNLGLDFDNRSAFSYQPDDYHFTISPPDAAGEVALSLVRTGGAPVEPREAIRARGARTASGYEITLVIDVAQLSGPPLHAGDMLGLELERRLAGGPFVMPIGWGDLVLAGRDGHLSPAERERAQAHQAAAAAQYEAHQQDPAAPEQLTAAQRNDLRRLEERIVDSWREEVDRSLLESYIATQTGDGTWADLRYEVNGAPDAAGCWEHLNRLVGLAVGRRFHGLGDDARDALHRGLGYWLARDFVFENWWRNEIGVPLQMGRIALLEDEALGAGETAGIVKIMRRSKRPMTGQNLVWVNKITVMRGVLEQNPALIERAFERIEDSIRITSAEGMQADFSFHQHGPQLYSHGYGAEFARDAAQLYFWSQGGAFEMEPRVLMLLENMVLDGNRWMARGTFADIGALGRGVARPGVDARYLTEVAAVLLAAEADRADELKTLEATASGAAADELAGNRYFYRSEFMVHRRPEFYASVKVYSKRMTGTEFINGEGLKSYYLPDGATLFVRDGGEYRDVFPLWEWRAIPGATIPVSETPIPLLDYRTMSTKGGADFAGGVSDGWFGAVGYDYRRDAVAAKKAYFGFDWGLVCLGADIRSAAGESLQTTVNQTWARGAVALRDGQGRSEEFSTGEMRLGGDATRVTHDGLVYHFPAGQDVAVSAGPRRGSWRELSRSGRADPIEGDVFELSLQHDGAVGTGSYIYAVTAEAGGAEADFVVLENSGRVQAVADARAGVYQLIFYAAGAVDLGDGVSVAVDRRCALLLRRDADGFAATVASPAREAGALRVTLSGGRGEAFFELPSGEDAAGGSVTGRIDYP